MWATIFDLDDTLYPERAYVISGFRAAATQLSLLGGDGERFFQIVVGLFEAGHRLRLFDGALATLGYFKTGELIDSLVEAYRCHRPTLKLFDDASYAMKKMRFIGPVGIITDGYESVQKRKLEALGVRDFVDAVIVTDEIGRHAWKPSPIAFEIMSKDLTLPAGRCIYVGDNPEKDFIAPIELGWKTVRIDRGWGEHSGKKGSVDEEAEFCVTSLMQLPDLVAGWNGYR